MSPWKLTAIYKITEKADVNTVGTWPVEIQCSSEQVHYNPVPTVLD